MTIISRIAILSGLHVLPAVLGFFPAKTPTRSYCSGAPRADVAFGAPKSHPYRRQNYIAWNSGDDRDQELFDALDLPPIIEDVARYTGTRRGYAALTITDASSQNRQQRLYTSVGQKEKPRLVPFAKSLEEVHSEYDLVQEASLLIMPENSINNLSYPPLYGEDSSPFDVNTIPQTDDDEWLDFSPEKFTTEHILQAEQVLKMLLKLLEWSQSEEVQKWAPTLAQIGSAIEEQRSILSSTYEDIAGNVEIFGVKSLTDPLETISYSVRLRDDGFPSLRLMNEQEKKLMKGGAKEFDKDLVAIRAGIEEITGQILSSLAQKILGASASIDLGLDVAARLDVLMAKAAYSLSMNGAIPVVTSGSKISIENFLHPILLTSMKDRDSVVPIDLHLSSEICESALVISGPNGGGKTLSMKSFGLASILTKLGIPIPIKEGSKRPRVDFFDEIFVNVGDRQSVLDGESTWTAILNDCAYIIQQITEQRKIDATPSHLVLLDELGTGTDPESGGAVAQAILEELIANSCKVVVTTHLPRLKTLSYNSAHIGCAAVLLDYNDCSTLKRPSFRLEYGLIGESHALNAASRCSPSLPDNVLSRASELLNDSEMTSENASHDGYLQALTSSMEEQLERSRIATSTLQADAIDSSKCREAMISLARAYECELDRKMKYLEDTVHKLKGDGKDGYELVGETLSELKVVKKRIVTQEEKLATKGLKILPTNYVLSPGESIVIISDDKIGGMAANVVTDGSRIDSSLAPNEVLVKLSFGAWDDVTLTDIDPMMDRTMILQRQEIAIWNMDDIHDYDFSPKVPTSVENSKQRVSSLLSTLDSVSKKKSSKNEPKSKGKGKSFQSSRQRKAAKKGKKRGK